MNNSSQYLHWEITLFDKGGDKHDISHTEWKSWIQAKSDPILCHETSSRAISSVALLETWVREINTIPNFAP